MRIKGQWVEQTNQYLILALKEPYYGAYTKYHWGEHIEGFGINEEIILKALKLKLKIMVKCRNNKYEIKPSKALKIVNQYNSYYYGSNLVKIAVLPRNKFNKIPNEEAMIGFDSRIQLAKLWKTLCFSDSVRRKI